MSCSNNNNDNTTTKKVRKTIVNPNRLAVYNTFLATEILSKLIEKKIITEFEGQLMIRNVQMKTVNWKPGTKEFQNARRI